MADVVAGRTICVHYTTLPGGPKNVTWKVLSDPRTVSGGNFGKEFQVKHGGFETPMFAHASGLEPWPSSPLLGTGGWDPGTFTTAGACP